MLLGVHWPPAPCTAPLLAQPCQAQLSTEALSQQQAETEMPEPRTSYKEVAVLALDTGPVHWLTAGDGHALRHKTGHHPICSQQVWTPLKLEAIGMGAVPARMPGPRSTTLSEPTVAERRPLFSMQ